jgi:hypothetical protein
MNNEVEYIVVFKEYGQFVKSLSLKDAYKSIEQAQNDVLHLLRLYKSLSTVEWGVARVETDGLVLVAAPVMEYSYFIGFKPVK